MARHAQPCSLHAALRALGAQAPRKPAPGQQVSTTSSASEGAEGWPSRSERTRACPVHPGRAQRLRQSLLLLVFQFASARKLARCVPDRSARGPFLSPAAAARAARAHKALKRRPLPFSRKLAFLVPPARCTAAVTRTPKQRSQYCQALGGLPGGSQWECKSII